MISSTTEFKRLALLCAMASDKGREHDRVRYGGLNGESSTGQCQGAYPDTITTWIWNGKGWDTDTDTGTRSNGEDGSVRLLGLDECRSWLLPKVAQNRPVVIPTSLARAVKGTVQHWLGSEFWRLCTLKGRCSGWM